MKTISSEAILQQLRWRYATKKFDPSRKISQEDWQVLENALVLTPSSFGLQPWKFFVITDSATLSKLPEFSWGQMQVAQASHLVVFAVKEKIEEADIDRHLQRIAEVRGGTVEALAPYRKMMVNSLITPPETFNIKHWATNQAYIALGQFMAVAAMLGIDTCPMEGFLPEKYDEILGLTEQGYNSVVIAPAGYRATDCKYAALPKVRFKNEEVVVPAKGM